MVLEMFATDTFTDHKMLINHENPVQRNPEINYFSSDTINVRPIISHISSNGYYGYCSPPNASTQIHQEEKTDVSFESARAAAGDDDNQMEISVVLTSLGATGMHRKRSLTQTDNENDFKVKRLCSQTLKGFFACSKFPI